MQLMLSSGKKRCEIIFSVTLEIDSKIIHVVIIQSILDNL